MTTAPGSYMEVQLRTKRMDDIAEIGPANHLGYEKRQENERARRDAIPVGENIYFDEAYERGMQLLQLDLSSLDVNMFSCHEQQPDQRRLRPLPRTADSAVRAFVAVPE